MRESLGDIVGGVLEAAADVATSGGPPDRPRWLRWFWIGLLVFLAIGVLAVLLWPR